MDIFYPIQIFADFFTYNLLNITNTYWASTINFFVYDIIKIGLLLLAINYIMSITRYYFPVEKVRDILSSRKWFGFDYFLAAVLGVVTPFCSCSSIPLFIGFLGAGIPLGVTFAFLIASPLVNEASLFIFPSIFGLKLTLVYNLIGILIAMLGGFIIGRFRMDKNVNPDFLQFTTQKQAIAENKGEKLALKKRMKLWWKDGFSISKSIFPYVVLGVGLGALIHGFVPEDFVQTYLSGNKLLSVPLAVIIGAPFYANSVSVIPVIEAMASKGIPLGTALAFMTATVTLSVPSILILKKAMNWKLLSAFITVTSIGIMIIGYYFNFV